jgi:crotonobetainyl-CoA:carnitine CoA-transferase CaiB-like acyl-CoA transferase
MNPVPALGQHTDAILESMGWTRADIDNLRREGAI